ncbi:hypothetical protein KSP40_PGU002936 [Platanthera guangdongensis]|uniref:Uncharacterized protein n=1 Tax=Platanthera guangdongensis TaxID=2320717 RepID=A0ABR2MF89_9ASPA
MEKKSGIKKKPKFQWSWMYRMKKVSEIHVEPDNGQDIAKAASDGILKSDECILESNGSIQTMGYALESFRTNGGEDVGSVGQSEQMRLLGFNDSGKSEDVVSVPLDDNVHGLKPTGEVMDSEQTIPISDAPLIGAPFRLITFVTRYVSGADLVDQPKSLR